MNPAYVAKRFGMFLLIIWLAATVNFFLPRLGAAFAAPSPDAGTLPGAGAPLLRAGAGFFTTRFAGVAMSGV